MYVFPFHPNQPILTFHPQPGEVHYGTFSTSNSDDGKFIFLFATVHNGTGINLARAPTSHPADRRQYTYWTGKTWSQDPPSPNDPKAHVVSDDRIFTYGDFLYSPHYETWLLIYFIGPLDSTFHMRYSTSGLAQGPYSDPVVLYETEPVKDGFNYGGHAYGGYDKSGKKVVLSWTYNGIATQMAEVRFD